MNDQEVKKELEQLFSTLDVEKLLKRAFLDGFDTWGDYEKYGNAFTRIHMQSHKIKDMTLEDPS